MNVFDIVKGVLRTAAKVAGVDIGGDGGVLEKAASILDRVKETPEMRAELLKHEEEMKRLATEEMHVANEEALAMIASQDRFVSRARPTGLYLFYGCSVALVLAHIAGVKIDPGVVTTILLPLGGTGGLYIWKRTAEKMNGGHGD